MNSTALPPGPRTTLLPILDFLRDPYGSGLRAQRRWGDPYTAPTTAGPIVVTGDPDGVREILSADPDTFAPFGVELLGNVIGQSSLIILGGTRHRAARKLLAPPFHGARMRAYAETMRAVTVAETARWRPGEPFRMQRTTQAISLQVIIRSVFGVSAPDDIAGFQAALVDLIARLRPSFIFLRWLQHMAWPAWRRFQAASQRMEALVGGVVAARQASGVRGDDILSLLLDARYDDGEALSTRETFEQLMTVLVAGHETTAIALAWACHLVHTHREVEARLVEEIRALGRDPDPERVTRLPYLEAVCQETLRLMPLTPTIARKLARPFSLRGHALPAGVSVAASVIALHRRPELYPEPEAFRPERFLGRSFAPHEFLPFGGGVRRCLGAAFALYEMKMVLATMLERHALTSAERGTVRVEPRSTVVGPRGGVRMTAALRS
jgi:cytochrome P450